MGPPLYMWSVVDQNVMRCMTVHTVQKFKRLCWKKLVQHLKRASSNKSTTVGNPFQCNK